MPIRNPIGFNIDGKTVPASDEHYLTELFRRQKPTSIGVMDSLGMAYRFAHATGGEALVWYRRYGNDDSNDWEQYSAQAYVDSFNAEFRQLPADARQKVWIYCLNEANPQSGSGDFWEKMQKQLDWMCDVIEFGTKVGYKFVMGNFSTGSLDLSDIQTGRFDRFFNLLAEHGEYIPNHEFGKSLWDKISVVLGVHWYTGVLAPYGCAGRDHRELFTPNHPNIQESNWPTQAEIYSAAKQNANWHIFRDLAWDFYLQEKGIPLHYKLATEILWDNMPNLNNEFNFTDRMKQQYGLPDVRGHQHCFPIWRTFYPYRSAQQSMAAQTNWFAAVKPQNCIGGDLFQWGPGTEWDIKFGFNLKNLAEYHNLLIQWTEAQTVATCVEAAGAGRIFIVHPPQTTLNVRLCHEITPNNTVGVVTEGEEVVVWVADKRRDTSDKYDWVYLESNDTDVRGWAALVRPEDKLFTAPPPEPEPEPEPEPDPSLGNYILEFRFNDVERVYVEEFRERFWDWVNASYKVVEMLPLANISVIVKDANDAS